jgi:hypothetical protein
LILVVLEGALRKWVLPQASQFIYFLKDFVLIGAYLRYFCCLQYKLAYLPRRLLFLYWSLYGSLGRGASF